MSKITYVTALLDIKRDQLESNSFKRPFSLYLDKFKKLLTSLKDEKLVVYIHPENFEFVKKVKVKNIILKPLTCEDIVNTEYYEPIQKIRNKEEWKNQKGWLRDSTQANLELYNPLIFQKIHFLNEVATSNPLNSEYFIWVDAGIANAQADPSIFSNPIFKTNLISKLNKFLFICFPYQNYSEIHGFKAEGINEYVTDQKVDKVARATFFGGKRHEIEYLTDKFRELALDSLDKGYMGTEESIYTLLVYLYSDYINAEMTGQNGLVRGFLNSLLDNQLEAWNGKGSFVYKQLRTQQNPNAFDIFKKFFSRHKNIDLVLELGTGGGGMSLFLNEECKKNKCKFITYDNHQRFPDSFLDKIDFRKKDLYEDSTIKEIKDLIRSHKRVLVLCDGGNKQQEYSIFSDALKVNDFIMVHDYAPDQNYFSNNIEGKKWNWLEIQDRDLQQSDIRNGLEPYFTEFLESAWGCRIKTTSNRTDLYVLTYNAPEQFKFLCESIIEASPEMFDNSDKYVINNSLDESTFEEYEKLFEEYNFTEFKKDNIGICGGRQFIAEHFDTTPNKYMFFFEDDMNMNPPEDLGKTCKNGFNKFHPNFYNAMLKIMEKENFDFLKWTFTEFFGDNHTQWAWYNVPQQFREEHWPDSPKLPKRGLDPNAPKTVFRSIQSIDRLPYVTGEIYYCNWPQTVSKKGNKKMFLETTWKHPFEQTWMSYMFKKTIKNELKPGLLLLSPITHERFKHYGREERREN